MNNDEKMEEYIGSLLRIGVFISVLLMSGGVFAYLGGTDKQDMLMKSGLFILILTPVIRVVASIFIFAAQKNKKYVVITVIVLLVLFAAFLVGIKG